MAVFHDDSLGLEVFVERLFAEVFAKSGHLESSEWCGHVGLVVGVDEAGAGVDALGNAHGLVEVVGQHTGRKPVLSGVGAPNNLEKRQLSSNTDNVLSSALLSSGKALSSGQNPASRQFLFSKSSQ